MYDYQGSKKSLQVTIENLEFAKSFHYFVTVEVQGDGLKRRSDISEQVSNPVFTQNKFYLPVWSRELESAEKLRPRQLLEPLLQKRVRRQHCCDLSEPRTNVICIRAQQAGGQTRGLRKRDSHRQKAVVLEIYMEKEGRTRTRLCKCHSTLCKM